jgi:serine/threonine protein kinase
MRQMGWGLLALGLLLAGWPCRLAINDPRLEIQARRAGGPWIVTPQLPQSTYQVRLSRAGYLPVPYQPGQRQVWLWPNPAGLLTRWPLWICLGGAWLLLRNRSQASSPTVVPVQRQQVASYQVLRKLGEGSHAVVFLAEAESGLKVALKILRANDPDYRQRFLREAELCSQMEHPRIIRTLGWGEHQGRLWMAQQYHAGQTLDQWVRPRGRHAREVRQILTQVAEGLDYAHQLGVFHRDLKPANILLNSRGEAVIADFGLARCADFATMTRTQETFGSPAYMAPEQIRSGRVENGSADLYSLGVLGYELLYGRLPFEGDLMQVLQAHLCKIPEFPAQPGGPVEAIIRQLLEKDPARRPASARELISRLQR